MHVAIRWLLHQAALGHSVDPDRLSFTGGLRAMRRELPQPEGFSPKSWTSLIAEAVREVSDEQSQPRLRANPRVLKRALTYHPPKRAKRANWPQPTKSPEQAIVKQERTALA